MSHLNARNTLILAIVVLVVCSLLPARYLGWTRHGRNIAVTLTAPVQQPLRWLVSPAPDETLVDETATLESLQAQLDEAQLQIARLAGDNQALRHIVEDLQSGASLLRDTSARQFAAYVIGGDDTVNGNLLKVRAGARQGVTARSSVAVVAGVHVVGRVVDVAAGHCLVQPITDKTAGTVQGVIMLADGTPGPRSRLSPTGDGALFGRVGTEGAPNDPAWTPAPGMLVRVDDAGWPPAAQMRIIGRIEKVEPSPDQPLHKRITVRPEHTITEAALVVLMIPHETGMASGAGERSAP